MKYALFLQDMHPPRGEVEGMLAQAVGGEYRALWFDDPRLGERRGEVEVLVTCEHAVPAAVLAPWPNLKMVSLAFTGYDQVDREYCRTRSIQLYYAPDYSSDSVAELTVGLTLALLRKLVVADLAVRSGAWHGGGVVPGVELHGKQVGILGTGRIGMKTANLFRAFGCAVAGWARTRRQQFLDLGCTYVDRPETIFAESDVVVLHLPVEVGRGGTRHLVGREQLRLMRPGSVLINTARSGLVDTEALADALHEGRISGAGIDVFDEEPPAASLRLLGMRNTVVTPHVGFRTEEALRRLAATAVGNIGHFLTGSTDNRLP